MTEETGKQPVAVSGMLATALKATKEAAGNVGRQAAGAGLEAAWKIDPIRTGIETEITSGIKRGVTDIVGNIRENFSGITSNLAEGIDTGNDSLWGNIKDTIVSDNDRGFRRLFKTGLAGFLWVGARVTALITVGLAETAGFTPEDKKTGWYGDEAQKVQKIFNGFLAKWRNKEEHKFDQAKLDDIATTIAPEMAL